MPSLADPLVASVLLPFIVAFALALALRGALGPTAGRRLAVAGAVVGLLLAITLISGVPPLPPISSTQKIFWIVLVGLAVGVVLDLTGSTRRGGHAFAFLIPLFALAWLTERLWSVGGVALVTRVLALFAASVLIYWRVAATARGSEEDPMRAAALFPPLLVLVSAVAVSLLALLSASASLSILAAALAAASGGFALASFLPFLFGGRPLRFDATGAFGLAGALLALVYVLVLFNEGTELSALIALLFVFLFDIFARPVALMTNSRSGAGTRVLRPLLYTAIIALPALAALAYVWVIVGARPG
jgi:hypothetical protein